MKGGSSCVLQPLQPVQLGCALPPGSDFCTAPGSHTNARSLEASARCKFSTGSRAIALCALARSVDTRNRTVRLGLGRHGPVDPARLPCAPMPAFRSAQSRRAPRRTDYIVVPRCSLVSLQSLIKQCVPARLRWAHRLAFCFRARVIAARAATAFKLGLRLALCVRSGFV
jgi:hypothetical protein